MEGAATGVLSNKVRTRYLRAIAATLTTRLHLSRITAGPPHVPTRDASTVGVGPPLCMHAPTHRVHRSPQPHNAIVADGVGVRTAPSSGFNHDHGHGCTNAVYPRLEPLSSVVR